MDLNGVKVEDRFIDLESGASDSDETVGSLGNSSIFVERASDGKFDREEKAGIENSREKARRKASKPPLPPKSSHSVVVDGKMAREKPDHTMSKRTRLARMKAFRKKKNGKATFSNGYIGALVITIMFCAIIIWQGVFSKGRSSGSLHDSPESSLGSSVEFYGNLSTDPLRSSYLEQVIGIHGQNEASRASE